MNSKKGKIGFFIGICLFLFGVSADAEFKLIQDGKAKAIIVMPSNPGAVVKYAAKELNYHIKKASGAELPIVSENHLKKSQKFRVYLGNCNTTRKQLTSINQLPVNAFRIKTTANALFLVGSDGNGTPPDNYSTPMGTLFAVYEWLQMQLGVKWLWPGESGTVVPHMRSISSGVKLDVYAKPPFIATRIFFGGNRRQTHEANIWLRRHRIVQPVSLHYGHAYTGYWDRFGKTHPEYFAQRPDGVRAPATARQELIQMCVSNTGLHKQIIEDWLKQRKNRPDLPWINGCENDRTQEEPPCMCEKCKSWDAGKSSYSEANPWLIQNGKNKRIKYPQVLSDRYARFWLALQKEARKYDPEAMVYGFAYSTYKNPPVEAKLNKNIFVNIVPGYTYPKFDKQNNQFRKLWDGWSKTGASLGLRPNYFLSGYCMPYIFAEQFGEDFKYAYKHGMVGTSFDMSAPMWGVQGPNLYMLGRLHEKPDMTVTAVLDEYYSGFAPAEKQVRAYFKYWQGITMKVTPEWRKSHGGGWAKMSYGGDVIYTPETFKKGFELLEEAKRVAKNNKETLLRIAFLSEWLQHAKLAMKALSASHAFKRQRNTQNHKAFLAAKNELDKFRKNTDITLNKPFLKRLELWSGVRGGHELKPEKLPAQQILDGLFNYEDSRWGKQIVHGSCNFGIDKKEKHSSKPSAFINCTELEKNGKSWARYYTDISVVAGQKYKLKLWIKTSTGFNGVVLIWPPGKPRLTVKPTQGEWKEYTLNFVAGKSSKLYLNLWNGKGKVWFANISLEEENS
jgi:uncharacterized protein DUF4838